MQANPVGYENPYPNVTLPLDQQQQVLASGNFAGVQPRTRLERVSNLNQI